MASKRQKGIVRESTPGYGGCEGVLYRAPDGAVQLLHFLQQLRSKAEGR